MSFLLFSSFALRRGVHCASHLPVAFIIAFIRSYNIYQYLVRNALPFTTLIVVFGLLMLVV